MIADLLIQYQYPIATTLAAGILYVAQQAPWFAKLGDWTKRAALALSAAAVIVVVRAVGGEVTQDVHALVAVLFGGAASAVPGAVAFRMGRVK